MTAVAVGCSDLLGQLDVASSREIGGYGRLGPHGLKTQRKERKVNSPDDHPVKEGVSCKEYSEMTHDD